MAARTIRKLAAAAICGGWLSGCAGMSHTENGALVGTGLGALLGGVIGHQAGSTGAGAVLGGAAGLLAGSAIGSAEDAREERDWAMSQVRQAEYQRHMQPPLTNADLIYMTQNGLGDQVIINAVHQRGGQFNLDPASLVQLKQNGVSDSVLMAIQNSGQSNIRPVSATRYVVPQERVVIVHPVPPPPVRASFSFGSGPACYGRHHHW